jgi:pimeloyl-ACP methyl ester carboxylesterase
MPTADVNGIELYHELRGAGPPLLLIMGASGDGGVFDRFADLLAEEFTVVTYDRRGNGRSPRPVGWETTSPEEQADDAAALLDALGFAPAAVFGTSSGGIFTLAMLIRRPDAVRAALLHEPALFTLFDDPEAARSTVTETVSAGMEAGGPPAAFERFIRLVAGDANWEQLNPSVRKRILASAGTYFGNEIGTFDTYLPDHEDLAKISAPVHLLVSDDSLPYFAQAAGRLATRLHVDITRVPGTHFSYLDHPTQLAQTVSALLRNGGRSRA